MSPQNCSAILSPCWVGSSPQRRRSDEGMGVKGESERVTADARSAADVGGAGECGERAKVLGISARQMKRLRRKLKERGIEALLHGNRGKQPWNKTASEKMEQVIKLARGQ